MAGKKPLLFERGLGQLLKDKEHDVDVIQGDDRETSSLEHGAAPPEPVVPLQPAVEEQPAVPEQTPVHEPVRDSPTQVATVTIDDVDIFQSFVQESQDHLSNIEDKILKLEDANDSAVVNEIFRSMHTMKGSSSFFGLEKIKTISHSLESALDSLRSDRIQVSPELIDVLLAGTDLLVQMIDELDSNIADVDPTKVPVEIAQSSLDINPIMNRVVGFDSPVAGEPAGEADSTLADTTQNPGSGEPLEDAGIDDLITPELRASFRAEAKELLDQAERDILALEKTPSDLSLIDGAFRAVHTLKGNAGFLGFGEVEKICMELETNLDAIRKGKKQARPKTITILLNTIDSMSRLIGMSDQDADSVPADSEQDTDAFGDEDSAETEVATDSTYKPLGEILIDLGETTEEAVEEALDNQERKVGEILLSEGAVSESGLQKALGVQQESTRVIAAESPDSRVERKDIRVDMSKLDKLFDLMGELITAEAMVIHNPEVQEIESFTTAAVYLGKITREMQELTMSVRMIPLEGLFNKMRRLVRDLSRRFGKKVDFQVSGQDTEMDRNIIEQISDPLIHIIRNSIDHGIDEAGNRVAAGKSETGTIQLSARYEGNEIWITVADDGRGLDRDRILAKAGEKGLLRADPDTMSDNDVWQLLFEPGFSTAEQVSEISGRGVGMDVVKRNIEKLRGKIVIDSTLGAGTELVLRIPLTLAIIDGVTFHVGDVLYALPLSDILEFYKAREADVTRTASNRQVLRLREELIPVIKLHEFFGTQTERSGIEDGIIIVVQVSGRKAGLLVDGIAGYQQIVVKALPEYLGVMRAISGCSIMGNGEVSLIVDSGSLLKEELEQSVS
jgi:two-component system, chemotaxis family, sensor kinase CheA